MTSEGLITLFSVIVPGLVVVAISVWFRSSLDKDRLFALFVEVFTVFAGLIVLTGSFVPSVFDAVGDNKAFLIVVSLSAVLNAMSQVAKTISRAKSRSHIAARRKTLDGVN